MTTFFFIGIIVLMLIFGLIAFFIGKTLNKFNIIKISDTFTPDKERSEIQQKQDAVMLLKDEIAKSGALKITPLENGKVEVTLTLIQ